MKNSLQHYYLFKGNWFDYYDDLVEILQPDIHQKFSIWEPQDKTKEHSLIIVYGMPLDESYCTKKNIWRTDINVFNHFYLANLERFIVHGTKKLITIPSNLRHVA